MASQITITLPEPLAQEARAQGLLQQPAIEQLLKRELVRKSFERLADLRKLPGAAPGEAEIQQEIAAVRNERRK